MNRYSRIGEGADPLGAANALDGEARSPNLPTECSSCEQPYDPAGWCERCQQFAHEQPPEKTLAQWIAENREIAAAIKAQVFLEAQVRQLGDGTVRLEL
jgi:hypothetical protein